MRLRLTDRKFVGGFFAVNFVVAWVLLGLTGGLALGQSAALPLPQGGRITVEGVVRSPAGDTVGDTAVRLEGKDAAHSAETKTKADGTFVFSLSEPGKYMVRAEKPGMRDRGSSAFELSAGEKKHVDLTLEPLALGQTDSGNAGSRPAEMEFDDKPNFTVAGVTDWNNAGMHGSDVTARTSEALAKETLALKNGGAGVNAGLDTKAGAHSLDSRKSEAQLRAAREQARKMLASGDTPDVHRVLGELDERLGEPLEAVREYERAAQMDPSERNYFEWGTELLLHKADQPAVEVFTKGTRLHPGSARMLAGLGAALYASGSYEEAARRICEASDLQPGDSAPYLFLGKMQKSATALLPCSEEKLARFVREQPENAAGIDPKCGEAYLQLGILHSGRGGLDQAIRDYKKAIEASPQLSEPHYRLGLTYRRMGEESKAKQEFRVYGQMEKAETAALESRRRELRQFLIILKDQPAASPPH